MFGRRPDAIRVKNLSPLRRFMPYVSPRRSESLVWASQTLDVTDAMAAIDAWNATHPDLQLTLFQVVLRGIAQTLHARPRLNRFTAGRQYWQRDGVWLSFSAKQAFADDAPVITVKRAFSQAESLADQVAATQGQLTRQRGGEQTQSDKEMSIMLRLPRFAIRFVMWCAARLNDWGLLPGGMIRADPLFASAFVANLGSVGVDGGYHHLWEWGTCPIFCVIGRLHIRDDRQTISLKWTYDERIADAFYAAQGLAQIKNFIEDPAAWAQ